MEWNTHTLGNRITISFWSYYRNQLKKGFICFRTYVIPPDFKAGKPGKGKSNPTSSLSFVLQDYFKNLHFIMAKIYFRLDGWCTPGGNALIGLSVHERTRFCSEYELLFSERRNVLPCLGAASVSLPAAVAFCSSANIHSTYPRLVNSPVLIYHDSLASRRKLCLDFVSRVFCYWFNNSTRFASTKMF